MDRGDRSPLRTGQTGRRSQHMGPNAIDPGDPRYSANASADLRAQATSPAYARRATHGGACESAADDNLRRRHRTLPPRPRAARDSSAPLGSSTARTPWSRDRDDRSPSDGRRSGRHSRHTECPEAAARTRSSRPGGAGLALTRAHDSLRSRRRFSGAGCALRARLILERLFLFNNTRR